MRDIRDPQELYSRIQHEMRTHHCTILEAADRVELHRALSPAAQESTSLTTSPGTNGVGLTSDLWPGERREKGAQ